MSEDFARHELMRFEFFEYLLPFLICTGTDEEMQTVYNALKEDGSQFLYEMFENMCEQDHITNPYKDTDFKVETLNRGGIELIKMELPPYNPDHNDVQRAYLASVREKDGTHIKRCFTIHYFVEGVTGLMYAVADGEVLLVEELDQNRLDDIEYEYWRVVNGFVGVYLREEKQGKTHKKIKRPRKKSDKS